MNRDNNPFTEKMSYDSTPPLVDEKGIRATNADGSPKFNEKGEPVYVAGSVVEPVTLESVEQRLSDLEQRFKRG